MVASVIIIRKKTVKSIQLIYVCGILKQETAKGVF
jgi:hypothetical protein